MQIVVALVVLVTAIVSPLAQSFVTIDHACCNDDAGSDGDAESHDDDERSNEPQGCADRGCCVVGCHVVTTIAVPNIGVAPVSGSAPELAPEVPTFVQPPGGIYRPPRV